ncbi:FMN-binding protein [Gulosibacter sp. ACHW.36C]|uniref:FMN-binding protein n=1 Tax=Gulosibacter sediminis TaxID=1729695 RepID=A0ABY4N1X2_9MICO|nr:FMN-binding protein [Gulosibacter sediminis]UQN16019.1 FMN-binding protein [Gulosibacter sediminis]
MKRIAYTMFSLLSGITLLVSFRASLDTAPSTEAAGAAPQASAAAEPANPEPAVPEPVAPEATTSASPPATSSSSTQDGTYRGDVLSTRYGTVEVDITVSNGQITNVDVPHYPDSNPRDQAINSRAIPQLVSETLAAQGAQIDLVSGATYTSDGYVQSLQAALDQAQL